MREIGNFLNNLHVKLAIVEEKLSTIAAPLISLFGEGTTHHFINQIGELGAGLLNKLGET